MVNKAASAIAADKRSKESSERPLQNGTLNVTKSEEVEVKEESFLSRLFWAVLATKPEKALSIISLCSVLMAVLCIWLTYENFADEKKRYATLGFMVLLSGFIGSVTWCINLLSEASKEKATGKEAAEVALPERQE